MLLHLDTLSLWIAEETTAREAPGKQLLYDVSLQVDSGQTVALVGESGSGKSVTALSVLRLLEESSRVRMEGSIHFNELEITSLPRPAVRSLRGNQIAMIFQEPMTSLNPVYSIGSQMIEPLMLHRKMTRHEAEKEAARLLDRTGISDSTSRLSVYPHQLSGGQRQRVMIAMALACRPRLLIADEPTTALDVTIQAQILDLIADLQQEFKMAVLLISHDLTLVRRMADTLYIMKDGKIVETGQTERIFSEPTASYTRHLLSALPSLHQPKKIDSPPLLRIDNLTCSFSLSQGWLDIFGKKTAALKALDAVSFCFQEGLTYGIIGESGSGKTTLAQAVLKLVHSSGTITFNGHALHLMSGKHFRPLRKEIQIVFQDPYSSLSPRMTIEEIVAEGLTVHYPHLSKQEIKIKVFETLADVGLEPEMAHRYPHEFSGGQRQRIAIARAIILKPKLLFLDEPTSALDVTIQAQILDLLHNLQQKHGLTYIFISHDLRVIRGLADYVIVMQKGQIIESGPSPDIFKHPRQEYTQHLFQAALLS